MSKLHLLSDAERKDFFEAAAGLRGISFQIIEKDFWVVWMLERLFAFGELKDHLTFKGGTSLSKVYGLIERFSEDVDVSIEKAFFGFADQKDPEKMVGTNKQKSALTALSAACADYVGTKLLSQLQSDIKNQLGSDKGWSIFVDPEDHQTLQFEYPSQTPKGGYIKPSVKIEVGARSEHWPAHEQGIQSYAKETLKEKVTEPAVIVKVLDAERTFWEKATILHQYAHLPADKKLPPRISRHYYDFFCLLGSLIKQKMGANVSLLDRVTVHKSIYYASAWAHYETAKVGTLVLVPSKKIREDLERDYKQMNEMFFGDVPEFENIIARIEKFETDFNKK